MEQLFVKENLISMHEITVYVKGGSDYFFPAAPTCLEFGVAADLTKKKANAIEEGLRLKIKEIVPFNRWKYFDSRIIRQSRGLPAYV